MIKRKLAQLIFLLPEEVNTSMQYLALIILEELFVFYDIINYRSQLQLRVPTFRIFGRCNFFNTLDIHKLEKIRKNRFIFLESL